MKKFIILVFLSTSISSVFASTCIDLSSNLSPKAESSPVLTVQQFLFEKSFLLVKPNGYFGPSTIKAVKAYQKSKGLAQSGAVFPMTRAAIKKDTCMISQATSTILKSTTTSTSSPVQVTPVSTGTNPPTVTLFSEPAFVSYGETPTLRYTSTGATSCRLIPSSQKWVGVELFGSTQDPNITSTQTYTFTCTGLGGTTTKSVTVEVSPRTTSTTTLNEDSWLYPKPRIDTIDKGVFIINATTSNNLVINGANFSTSTSATSTNVIKGILQGTNKTFVFGTTTSVGSKVIALNSGFTRNKYPQGDGSEEYLPAGYYLVTVTTKGGESNAGFISLKNVTTRSVSGSPDASILPKTKHVKLGTVTLSSTVFAQQQSISFAVSGATGVSAKITNYTLKDLSTGVSLSGGPTFSFTKQDLLENQSKIYELYGDVGDILSKDAGSVTFSGTLNVMDYITNTTTQVAIPPFTVSVSY